MKKVTPGIKTFCRPLGTPLLRSAQITFYDPIVGVSDSRYVLEEPSSMTAPGRLVRLVAAILSVTPRIGYVESFVAHLPVCSHVAPFSSEAKKTASSCLVQPVCRSSEIDTTQDGTADGTGRHPDRVQQPLPLSSSTATPTPRSRVAARGQKDAGSNNNSELTLGRWIMLYTAFACLHAHVVYKYVPYLPF